MQACAAALSCASAACRRPRRRRWTTALARSRAPQYWKPATAPPALRSGPPSTGRRSAAPSRPLPTHYSLGRTGRGRGGPTSGANPPARRLPTPAGPSGRPVIGPKLAIPSSVPTESASTPVLVQAGSGAPTEHETPPPNCSAPPAAGRASATAWSSVRAQITAPRCPPRIASPRPSHQPPCAATCAAALRPAGWRGSGAR